MYLHYAKPYLALATLITLISWRLVYVNGPGAISGVLFLKVTTLLLGLAWLRGRHKLDIFFYQNIGYGELQLLMVVGTVDMVVWLLGITTLIITLY